MKYTYMLPNLPRFFFFHNTSSITIRHPKMQKYVDTPPVFRYDFDPSPSSPMYVENPDGDADLERSNKEHLMIIVVLGLRGLCSLFSFLCFVIILTVNDFTKVHTYNYVVAVALLSLVYNVIQTGKGINKLVSVGEFISHDKVSALGNFIADQVITYLVVSGSSAGIAATNEGRQVAEGMNLGSDVYKEYDKAAAATSMLFFAFIALAFPTLLSFHKLSQYLTTTSS